MEEKNEKEEQELLDVDEQGNPVKEKEGKKEEKSKKKLSFFYHYLLLFLLIILLILLYFFFIRKQNKNKSIFDKTKLKNLNLKNRVFKGSSIYDSFNEGKFTKKGLTKFEELAKNDLAFLITGAAAVADYCPLYGVKGFRIDKDEVIDEYKKFTDIIHSHNSFIFAQLAHSGLHSTGDIIYSPSVNKGFTQDKNSKEMTKEDIIRIEEDFAKAAIRAKKSGFDGIQILGAQTSLISNFLSPKYNRRTDEYGGSDENRARFLIEIIKKIKNVVGNDMAISLKIESEDKNGIITESGFTKACLMAEEAGIDLIEVSGIDTPKNIGPYYYKPAKKIAEKLKIPVALIGGIKTFEEAEFILNGSKIEYIGLVTPLIREPDLIKKWENKNIN